MTAEQAIADISALPIDDQLRVVQAIWDRLPDNAFVVIVGLMVAGRDEACLKYRG
jgi:hypothetical protein